MNNKIAQNIKDAIQEHEEEIQRLKQALLVLEPSSDSSPKPKQEVRVSVANHVRQKLKEIGTREFTTHEIIQSLPNASSANIAVTLNRYRKLGNIKVTEEAQGRKGGRYKVVKPIE